MPPAEDGAEDLRKSFNEVRATVNRFWKRWKEEYLMTLRERTKWNKSREGVKVGQLVIMVDEVKHRGEWKLARVTKIIGDEEHVRAVEVKTAKKTFTRDITKLVALELDE